MKNVISNQIKPLWVFFLTLAMVLGSCNKTEDIASVENENAKLKTGTVPGSDCPDCVAEAEFTLWAGNGTGEENNAGTIIISNDETNLYVEFVTISSFDMETVHLWVGCDPSDVPHNKKGIPVPGQFPINQDPSDPNYHKVTIPLSSLTCLGSDFCCKDLYVFAHVESTTETLWGGNIPFTGPRWGWYAKYTLCCEEEPPTGKECKNETAFGGCREGGGNAWWYYHQPGDGVETLWAGQTLEAGTVEIVNGVATITLYEGWSLQNVSEPVKIQGYTIVPSVRPAAGQFTTYKGAALTGINVGDFPYYVIHVDVRYCCEVPN